MDEKQLQGLKGEISIFADREQFLSALIMATYSEEHQKINVLPDLIPDDLIQWAHSTGAGIAPQNDGIEIHGGGWSFTPAFSSVKSLGSLYLDLLQISYLRFHRKRVELIDFDPNYLKLLKPYLDELDIEITSEEDSILAISSGEAKALPKEFAGHHPWYRNDFLLQSWPALKATEYKELYTGRDFLINIAQTWGNDVVKKVPNTTELSELERRLLKLRGGLQDRRSEFKITPSLKHKKRFYPLWGDATFASTIAVLGVCLPGSDFVLKNIMVSSSRTNFFQLARKLGADIELTSKKDSLGESVANVKVKYTRELMGRKISGENLFQSIEEFALIALLACRAEGETVIRGFSKLPDHFQTPIKIFINNLKKTSIDIGEFEDGFVIRGKPELDASDFDAQGIPSLTPALYVLSIIAKGQSTLENVDPISYSHLNEFLEKHYG
jgi:hypothetical protein